MTVHRPPSLPFVRTTGIPMFKLVWEPATWYCTSMFWLIDICQNSVSADQYRQTLSRAQVSTHWVRVFFCGYPLTSCYFSIMAGSSSFFLNAYEISRVHESHFYIYMQGRQSLLTFLTVTRWSRSTSNFMFWLVKIWQVSSCGKFMQRLETCLLIAGADRVLCRLVMF